VLVTLRKCLDNLVIVALSARDPRDPPDGEATWRATVLVISRRIKQTILITLALSFSAATTPVLAQAAIIDAIMGGGTVIGKECVNAKVVELGADFGSRSINLLRRVQ